MSPPRLTVVTPSSCPARPVPSRPDYSFAPVGGPGRSRGAARRAHVVRDDIAGLPDARAWKAAFPAIWRAFLLDVWGDDPRAVAAAFGVRVQTARNWYLGQHAPSGDIVARAMMGWRRQILRAGLRVLRRDAPGLAGAA